MTPAARITLQGIDITANLIPAPFGLPLAGGGVSIPAGYLEGGPLLSLEVTDNEDKKSDAVELEIDNREQIPAPKKGQEFMVWLGYTETGLVYMGRYAVESWTKSGRPRTLKVSAKAVGFGTEIKSPKSRSYHENTVGEIVNKVAGFNNLTALVHPDLQSVKIGHIDQSSESDLHFMTRIAERVGGNFKLADGKMVMNKAGSGQLPSGTEAPVFAIQEDSGDVKNGWSATGSERGSYGSAEAYWQDTKKGERTATKEGSGKPVFRLRGIFKTEDEAKVAAKAKLAKLNRGKVSLELPLVGRPEIFAGARVQAEGFDPDVDGLFQIKTAKHSLNGSGLGTSLTTESTNEEGGDGADLVGTAKDDDGGGGGLSQDEQDAEDDATSDSEE